MAIQLRLSNLKNKGKIYSIKKLIINLVISCYYMKITISIFNYLHEFIEFEWSCLYRGQRSAAPKCTIMTY